MSSQKRPEILIADLVDRASDARMSEITRRDRWRITNYELEQIGPGRALCVGQWHPGTLTLRLNADGWYRISFISRYSKIRAKLTGDKCFSECEPVFENVEKEGWFDVEEVVWREADLTGKELIIDDRPDLFLLAVRLTPIEANAKERELGWPMFFTDDGNIMDRHVHRGPDDLFESAERVPQDSCVRVMVYGGISGDICSHFTKVGTEYGSLKQQDESWDERGVTVCKNLQQYHRWRINPAEAMVEYAHQRGWELHFYIRMRGWDGAVPNVGKASRFYLEHPEFRNVGPDGEPVLGLSVAYPEVRDHLAKFYAELACFGADGVSPCFIRGCPLVLYEPPMVDGFRREYGHDPRQLSELDPRWLDYTAKVVTTWIREVKAAVGPNCKLSPIIHGTWALNRRFGLDIATWVKEALVDDLFIMGHQYDRWGNHSQAGPEHLDFDYFQKLPGRERVRLWPMFYMSGWFEADSARQCAFLQKCLDNGADGYGFWDASAHPEDKVGNVWDLGMLPQPKYQRKNRLLGKYEMISWSNYLWNRYTPMDSW